MVERMGHKLPDPFIIFVALAVLVAALSALGAALGARVVLPALGEEVTVRSLLSGEGLLYILSRSSTTSWGSSRWALF